MSLRGSAQFPASIEGDSDIRKDAKQIPMHTVRPVECHASDATRLHKEIVLQCWVSAAHVVSELKQGVCTQSTRKIPAQIFYLLR